jgi:hypothetical protein
VRVSASVSSEAEGEVRNRSASMLLTYSAEGFG